jgi:hypothetical protein
MGVNPPPAAEPSGGEGRPGNCGTLGERYIANQLASRRLQKAWFGWSGGHVAMQCGGFRAFNRFGAAAMPIQP